MKIAILTTIIIVILWMLSKLRKKIYFYNTLTILLFVLVVFQAPLLYFYTFGFFTLFGLALYSIIGLGLSIWTLKKFKKDLTEITKFHKYGIYVVIFL